MPKRIVNTQNRGPEIYHPEIEYDQSQVVFDGQVLQLGPNPQEKLVVNTGLPVRENAKEDNTASGLPNAESAVART